MKTKNVVLYFVALMMMGFGISLYLKAGIGVGAWDVLHSNLVEFLPFLSYGLWVFVVGVVTVTFSLLLKFNLKSYFAIVSSLINGLFIDLFNWILGFDVFIIPVHLPTQLVVFFIALLFLGSGISLLVLTNLPPTPPDIFMLGLVDRFKLNFTVSKTVTEITVLIVAILVSFIGGKPFFNIGLGTILTTVFVGLIVGNSTKIWRKLFKL